MKKFVLLAILALAFLLRVVGISNHPSGFTPDEASFGYDAYSILKTGKDQWGNTLPLSFKSFGDYKLPVYTYLSIPSVALFGLNKFAVRLPNAIVGTSAVVATYYLVLRIFKKRQIATLASFLLAISPWSISLSRGAFEANLTTFFLPLGILLFYKSFENKKFLILSSLFFGINMFTYHTARLLTPLIVFFLIVENFKEFKNLKTSELIASTVFSIFLFISVIGYLGQGGSRISTSSIFSLSENVLNDRYLLLKSGEPQLIAKLFNNKVTYIAQVFIRNYLSYFSQQFLFTNGAGEGTYGMVKGVGILYLFEIAFILSFIFFNKNKSPKILIFWILLSPIPAALTLGPGRAANRAAFMLPAVEIISAVGGVNLIEKFKLHKNIIPVGYFVMILFLVFFLESYSFKQPVNESKAMIYGTENVMDFISSKNYKKIIFSKKVSEPQIYVAFFGKVDPIMFQKESKVWDFESKGLSWLDQMGEYSLGNFTFKNINFSTDSKNENTLLVGPPDDFPQNLSPNAVISYPDGTKAYYLYETK